MTSVRAGVEPRDKQVVQHSATVVEWAEESTYNPKVVG